MSCSKLNWTRDIVTTLIVLYEQYPCLYSSSRKDYHNKITRQDALRKIRTRLVEAHPMLEVTIEDLLKKLHGLRTQFTVEENKIKKSTVSGASSMDVYVPKLWCYEDLLFLRPEGSQPLHGESNLDIPESELDREEVLIETQISEPSTSSASNGYNMNTPQSYKRKQKDLDVENVLRYATETLQNVSGRAGSQSRHSAFAQMIEAEMGEISDDEMVDDLKEFITRKIFQAKRLRSCWSWCWNTVVF